jgi:hypothetical protein
MKIKNMKTITIFAILLLTVGQLNAQAYLGQSVHDITETDCNNNTERIYDVLATGKPILIFTTDMICGNTTAWGTTVRQYADLYASQYRTWVCADFIEANSPSEQCSYMQQYEQQTGMNTNSVFRFIDTTSNGPYDPATKCFQGYVVIGLDSTLIYVGNDLNTAVSVALNASQVAGLESVDEQTNSFNIYPNPVTSLLQFDTSADIKNIQIHNQTGELVFQSQLTQSKTIDVSDLKEGIYFLLMEEKNGLILSRKFLKQ